MGVDWVSDIASASPEWEVVNSGVNGDTLVKIGRRLEMLLRTDASFDHIVIHGGANDILIPHLSFKGTLFKKAQQQLLKKGYAPRRSLLEFELAYTNMIRVIRLYSNATIILTTLGRMNEDPGFLLNKTREEVNSLIREIALEYDCGLADTGMRMDTYLQDKAVKDYFLKGFINTAWLDQLQCRLFGRADSLSEERGLLVTVDGLHLNGIGGAIFRGEVEKKLCAGKSLSCRNDVGLTLNS